MTTERIENVHNPISVQEIESVIKTFLQKKFQAQNASLL